MATNWVKEKHYMLVETTNTTPPNVLSFFFFLFKKFFIYFNWRLITLPYCIGSATQQHEYATCSPSWTPLPPPSLYHLSGSSQCTSPKDPVSNLDWWFISYMILYMFPCHSAKSSHPLPLLQSPKDCSIHLCLFCCLAYGVIVTIFLNSIYMCYCTVLVFFFLTYFTLYNRLQFHPPH